MTKRRYSFKLMTLLSSAAVAATPLALAAAAGLMLAPTSASAANECIPIGVDPAVNGPTADTYTCNNTVPNLSTTGVTYSSAGNLTVNTTSSINVGTVGINLTGNGADTVTFTTASGNNVSGSAPLLDITAGTGLITITNAGSLSVTGGGLNTAIRAVSSGNMVLTNTGSISGGINSGGVTGTQTINNSGSWTFGGANTFSAGLSTFNNTGMFSTGSSGTTISGLEIVNNSGQMGWAGVTATGLNAFTNSGNFQADNTTLTYSGGARSFTNTGTVNLERQGSTTGADDNILYLVGATTFANSGTFNLRQGLISAPGTAYTGSGSALMLTRVDFSRDLPDCLPTAFGVSGCLDFAGGSTAGSTAIRVTAIGTTLQLAFDPNRIVLVDVTGGTSAEEHFTLDAASTGYVVDPILGPVLAAGGLFAYRLDYDPTEQEHALVSTPRARAFEYITAIEQVLSTWHTTSEVVSGRQADLHSGHSNGMWVRLIGERNEREFMPTFTSGDDTFTYDTSYSYDIGAAVVGFDVLAGENYTLGVHGGVVRTRMEMENSDTTEDMDGATVGLYGGTAMGPLTLDATFNTNLLKLDHNDTVLGDSTTNVVTWGGRAEAGWLVEFSEAFFLQPHVIGAFARSNIRESFPGDFEQEFEDVESMRAGAGLRVGGDLGSLGYWVTGRAWKEYADEANVTLFATTFEDSTFTLTDDLSGSFQELTGGVSFNVLGNARAFASAGMKFHDSIDSVNASLGVRWSW